MEISEILEKTGLNQKESMVYMALLELGTATVEAIATKAGTKRPTTYLILDDLQRKGLASIVPRAKKILYMPESPEKIISDLSRKQEMVKRFLPDLLALYNQPKDKPQVQMFSGKEGVKMVYQQIYSSKEVLFFGTIKDTVKIYPEGLQEFVKNKENSVRDLLTQSKEDLEYAKRSSGSNYQIRFLPENLEFPSDSALAGDMAVFFSFHPQTFALVIKSKEIIKSLGTMFELAWTQATPYEKIIRE